jgi:methyl-accepting chemotaxis protein
LPSPEASINISAMHHVVSRRLAVALLVMSAAAVSPAYAEAYPMNRWKYASGDEPARATVDYDDSAWADLSLPAPVKLGKPGDIFWLRGSFAVPDGAPPRLWFLTGKAGVALELYVDGEYCGSRGRIGERYDLRATHCAAILMKPSATEAGKTVRLALRCAYLGTEVVVPSYRIGGEAEMEFELGPANFWNGRLYGILSALCIFLGLYSLIQFAFKRNEIENLYFALALIFCSLYLLELGADWWVFPFKWARAITRASLAISMAFLAPFFAKFFGYRQSKAMNYVVAGLSAGSAVAMLAFAGNDSALSMIFNISLLPVMLSIGICAAMSAKAARAGKREAFPVLAAVVLGIALAGYDSYFTVIGSDPFVWLQGIAFFTLDISIFIALAMRQARLKADLEEYAREVEARKSELAGSLGRLGEAGSAAAKLASRLDEAAAKAASAAAEAAKRSESIGADTERQASEAREADRLVGDLAVSIDRVHTNLASQTESAEKTASAAIELQAGAQTVAQSIDRTAAFMGGLAALSASGEQAAAALSAAMARVSDASAGINEVVDAVNDFAERTNLLAMNAAIEATHSGQYGRGFTVIASEVKKLAAAQSERAARIRDIVTGISASVADGEKDAERLKSALSEIAAGSHEADERIEEVRRGTVEQERASEEIRSSMEALASAIASIRAETDRQAEYSRRVRLAVAAIAAEAAEVRLSARSIAEDGASLVEAVDGLRELTAKGGELTAALAGWGDASN